MQAGIKTSPYAQWLAYCENGELAYQFCPDDGQAVFYPRVIAPGSGSTNLEWRISAGQGTVYASTAVMQRDEEPYNVAVIQLDEGFRMLSTVEGIDARDVQIGLRVMVRFRRANCDGAPYPVFHPTGVAA